MMEIRFACKEDAKRLIEIYTYYVTDTTVTFEIDIPTVEDFENRIIQISKKYPYLVMEEDGEIIGYAYAGAFKGRKAYDWSVELSIYIDRPYQQKGVGRVLYTTLIDMLTRQGFAMAYACLTYPNPASEAFHQSLGFDMIGIFHRSGYKFNKWVDTCWLEKSLNTQNKEIKSISKIKIKG